MLRQSYLTKSQLPALLREIYKPPEKLYYRGDIEVIEKTCISIVGTRRMTDYGEEMTRQIIEEISTLDVVIVSGLAKGIDSIAHLAALDNGLSTIAVLGSGIDNIYPTQNISLARRIEQEGGLILSEYPADKAPMIHHFPERNRIVSGLSIATIVIEAPEKSGALITARCALEQGREIFVVPGDIDRDSSLGPLRLLQNGGAYPISSGYDIIALLEKQPHLFNPKPMHQYEIPQWINNKAPNQVDYNLCEQERSIFEHMSKHRGITLEKIQEKSDLAVPEILSIISILEIQGFVKKEGNKYKRLF